MFKQGEYVIYGNNGVCLIESIGPNPVADLHSDRNYYTLTPVYESVQIYAPVDTDVYMRPIISVAEVHQLISKITTIKAPTLHSTNSSELANQYRKLLRTHDCKDLLKLIKSIQKKCKKAEKDGRHPGLTDLRFLKQAEDLLYGEFSIVLNIERNMVEDYINNYIKDYNKKSKRDA